MKFHTVPTALECLVCRADVAVLSPYPQLCARCRRNPPLEVAALTASVDRMAKAWGAMVTTELEPRFMKMIEAASDLDAPMTPHQREEAMTKFGVRVVKTIEHGDDFAGLVEAWWAHRIRRGDLRALELQLAWAKIQTEGSNATPSKS
jgi:hypothetical protein